MGSKQFNSIEEKTVQPYEINIGLYKTFLADQNSMSVSIDTECPHFTLCGHAMGASQL